MRAYDSSVALVVVDVQNAFVDPDGALHVAGAGDLVPDLNAEIDAACAAGATVVYTQDREPVPDATDWQVRLYPGLDVAGDVVAKGPGASGGCSGFSWYDPATGEPGESSLGEVLGAAGVRRVVVTGLAGDVCVNETALDARRLGYEVTVPLRLTRFVHAHPEGDAAAVAELTAAGVDAEPAGGPFTAAELDYLAGQRIGRLATLGVPGPQVRPVGFRVETGRGTVDIGGIRLSGTQKWRNVERDGRVAFVVDDVGTGDDFTPRGIEIRGYATPLTADGEELIRIHPNRIISWGLDSDGFTPLTRRVPT